MDYRARFDELPEADHNIWEPWIKDSDPNKLLNYFRQFKRNPYPKNINIHSQYIRYGKQYWGKIIKFINPTKPGLLKAKIIDERHIKISTDDIKLFELNLDHPDLAKKGRIVLNINQYKEKKSIKKWEKFAEILSDFNVNEKISFDTKIGKYKIISDKKLLKLIESKNSKIKDSNFLLLGNSNQNIIIEKISDELPLKFHGKNIAILDKKYKNPGLIFTYPSPINKNNLISIISLPFKYNKIIEYAINLNVNLRMDILSRDISGFALSDLTVLKSFEKVSAIGIYNYNWKNLNILNIN